MPPKPPPPPPNVSTPRRRHRGAASSRSKSAAKELSSPHRPLRPSRKRSTRRHHRRPKPTTSSAFPARRRRRTRPRAILRPRPGRFRPSRKQPTPTDVFGHRPTAPSPAPQPKKPTSQETSSIVITTRTTPTSATRCPSRRRSSPRSLPPLQRSKRHTVTTRVGERRQAVRPRPVETRRRGAFPLRLAPRPEVGQAGRPLGPDAERARAREHARAVEPRHPPRRGLCQRRSAMGCPR